MMSPPTCRGLRHRGSPQTVTLTAPLAEGTYSLSAVATDAAANSFVASDALAVVVDMTAPVLAGISVTVDGSTATGPLHPGTVAAVIVTLGEAITLSSGGEAALTMSNGAVLSGGAGGEDGIRWCSSTSCPPPMVLAS